MAEALLQNAETNSAKLKNIPSDDWRVEIRARRVSDICLSGRFVVRVVRSAEEIVRQFEPPIFSSLNSESYCVGFEFDCENVDKTEKAVAQHYADDTHDDDIDEFK